MRRIALLLVLMPAPALGQSSLPSARYANTQLSDPRQEAEARALMETLRCLVCQGQSIADSDADMASDMRALVRERIARGEDADDVRDWLVERYGDYVSYDPQMSPLTAPLWLAPLVLMAVGVVVARASFKRRGRS